MNINNKPLEILHDKIYTMHIWLLLKIHLVVVGLLKTYLRFTIGILFEMTLKLIDTYPIELPLALTVLNKIISFSLP
jgi:hypothetical protein